MKNLSALTFLFIFVSISSLAFGNPDPNQSVIGDFIRNNDGTIKTRIHHFEAEAACEKKGSRLPTARELAKEAEKYGGKLLEENEYDAGNIPSGYIKDYFYKVVTNGNANANRKKDNFYYSTQNYKKPSGDLGEYVTWSSSLFHNYDSSAFIFLSFVGGFGDDIRAHSYYNYTARCVVGGTSVK